MLDVHKRAVGRVGFFSEGWEGELCFQKKDELECKYRVGRLASALGCGWVREVLFKLYKTTESFSRWDSMQTHEMLKAALLWFKMLAALEIQRTQLVPGARGSQPGKAVCGQLRKPRRRHGRGTTSGNGGLWAEKWLYPGMTRSEFFADDETWMDQNREK